MLAAAIAAVGMVLAVAQPPGDGSNAGKQDSASAGTVDVPASEVSLVRTADVTLKAKRPYPNARNTGVPDGVKLRPWTGGRYIRKSGAVLSGYLFRGDVVVQANNVTIKNSLVRGGRIDAGYGDQQRGLVVQDTEVDGNNLGSGWSLIGDVNYTCIRCDLHGGGSGPRMGGNVVIRDSYIHDLCCDDGTHKTAIGSNGGDNLVVVHNTVECAIAGCSAALSLYGPHDQVLIKHNLFNTVGGYCAYGGGESASNVRFVDNRFGRKFNKRCGGYGPVFAFHRNAGNEWQGNVWRGTHKAVRP